MFLVEFIHEPFIYLFARWYHGSVNSSSSRFVHTRINYLPTFLSIDPSIHSSTPLSLSTELNLQYIVL